MTSPRKRTRKSKPDTVVTRTKANFETLGRAFDDNNVALMQCQLRATGEPVAVICAVNWDDKGGATFAPFAMMFDGNPYDLLNPPDPDKPGGFLQPVPAPSSGSGQTP